MRSEEEKRRWYPSKTTAPNPQIQATVCFSYQPRERGQTSSQFSYRLVTLNPFSNFVQLYPPPDFVLLYRTFHITSNNIPPPLFNDQSGIIHFFFTLQMSKGVSHKIRHNEFMKNFGIK